MKLCQSLQLEATTLLQLLQRVLHHITRDVTKSTFLLQHQRQHKPHYFPTNNERVLTHSLTVEQIINKLISVVLLYFLWLQQEFYQKKTIL